MIKKNKVFIIAEIGINHNGNFKTALKMIDSAKRAGADAVKFQTYITEKRVKINSPIFDILKRCELSFDNFKKLKKYCDKKRIEFFSTPFDIESFQFLIKLKVKKIKIASFDNINLKFLKYMAKYKIDFIMSVGMSTLFEIQKAFNILTNKGKNRVSLLHCISAYPTDENNANLNCIDFLKKNFKCCIGQSDHTNGIRVPILAVAKGARIIEKHFKISENMKCADSPVSISEKKFKEMVNQIRKTEEILGDNILGIRKSEKRTVIYRRKTQ